MSLGITLVIVIFSILVLVGIIIIGIYNKILFRKKRVLDKFNSIYLILKERISIIDSICSVLIKNNFHEDNLIMDLNNLKKSIEENNSINETLPLINKTDNLIKKALQLDIIYESLKNNKEYQELKESFKNNQYKIMYSIEIYNEEVEDYNNYIAKKIINLVSKIFRFSNYSYYKKQDDI